MLNMTSEKVRELWRAEPFRKFTIHLSDGRKILVTDPDFLTIAPSGRTVSVFEPNDSLNIIDLPKVTGLEVQRDRKTYRRGKRA